jgi:hypothetical protein
MPKAVLLIINIKNLIWILVTVIKITVSKGNFLSLISILTASIKDADSSNIIFLTQKSINREGGVRAIFSPFSILKINKLYGKNIFIPLKVNLNKDTYFEITKLFSINMYYYDQNVLDFKEYNIKNFLRLITNTEKIVENAPKKIIVLEVTNSSLEEKWNQFIEQNLITNIYYDLNYLRQNTSISKHCFIYCSEHRIEAIETCFPGKTSGIKYRGLLARNRLKNEKVASYISKCSDIIQMCNLRRKSNSLKPVGDIYASGAIPPGLAFARHRCIIRPNYLYKHVSIPHLLENLETRHRTDYKHAVTSNYSISFKVEVLNNIFGQGEEKANFSGFKNCSQRIQAIVRDNNQNEIGGVEVYCVGDQIKTHYYSRSLAYQNAVRLKGGQTFAILEYMKAYCSEDDVFNFLGSRDKPIAKFFRGFGATLDFNLEVIW